MVIVSETKCIYFATPSEYSEELVKLKNDGWFETVGQYTGLGVYAEFKRVSR